MQHSVACNGPNMSFSYLAVICSLIICVSSKSLTLVIDTTYSMDYEINFIRSRIGHMLNSIGDTAIDNYILIPFDDPDVGPAQIFTSPNSFVRSIRALNISGGNDIPESSLTGIEKALQESQPESDIFLFTDACAKDEAKFSNIQELCRVTRSKVIVFMSGICKHSETNRFGNIEKYYDVAKVCFGNVFQLENNYEQAFTFMSEIVRNDYNHVKTSERFSTLKPRPVDFSVNSLTRDVIVAVTGESPVMFLSDESGQSPRTETLIATQHSLVVRIAEPHVGSYQISVRCEGMTSVTIYSRIEFPLTVGFSPLYPWNIEETTPKPLPGRESYIFVLVPKSYRHQLNTLTITASNGDTPKSVALTENSANARIYIAKTYFESGVKFRISVNWIDTNSFNSMLLTSKILEPQTEVTNVPSSGAVIRTTIPDVSMTYYKKNATVACKVTGCPEPAIWWEYEDGKTVTGENSFWQYPATYISYVTIPNITENKTISCKASTPTGKDSKMIQLYVYRPYVFEMIQTPKAATIEYEAEGRLYCQVNAYPEAMIIWYHNNEEIIFTTNETDDGIDGYDNTHDKELEYFEEDNALVIKNMTSQYVGLYRCDVRNDANFKSFQVEIKISGLESPELEMSVTELTTKLGEGLKIWCRISKGKPNPTVSWKYKTIDGYDFMDLPEDVEADDEKITITEVMSKHKGVYKCEVVNELGKDSREVTLKVIYAPKIENAETTAINVTRDDPVVLECSVDAEPKATVRWERSDGLSLPDDKHIVDGNALKFNARAEDSGSYRCIAENEAGTAEKTTNIDVLVPPYITPVPKNVTVRAGSPVRLSCYVQEGNPTPTVFWRFTDLNSKSTELSRTSHEIIISAIQKSQSGTYDCIVDNGIGFDRIQISVTVQ